MNQQPKVSMFSKSPYPGMKDFQTPNANEARFDLPPLNFEMKSNHRNTSLGPKLANYAERGELWVVKDLPDSHIYNH
jgi:hypothetical protein